MSENLIRVHLRQAVLVGYGREARYVKVVIVDGAGTAAAPPVRGRPRTVHHPTVRRRPLPNREEHGGCGLRPEG